MKTYRITIEMTAPYNPDKWDWDELIASEPDEHVISVRSDEVEPQDTQPSFDPDNYTCSCGNRADLDGFSPCLKDGKQVEPDMDGPWDGRLYVCERCAEVRVLA